MLAALLLLCASAATAPSRVQAQPAPPELKYCDICHSPAGLARDATVPDLAGQSAAYLEKQIRAFLQNQGPAPGGTNDKRAVERTQSAMHANGQRIAAADVPSLARAFAGRACNQTDPVRNPRSVPAIVARCALCHGDNGEGRPALEAPRLAGQSSLYLLDQLTAIRRAALELTRPEALPARSHPTMNPQLAPLGTDEMRGLADYFSGLPCR